MGSLVQGLDAQLEGKLKPRSFIVCVIESKKQKKKKRNLKNEEEEVQPNSLTCRSNNFGVH